MSFPKRILSPGIHLMEGLRLPGKFALIGAVFAACLGWLTFEMVRAQREIITFTEQESLGVTYLQSARKVFEQGILATEATAIPGTAGLEAARGAEGLAFQELEATDGRLGAALQTTEPFKALRESWGGWAPPELGKRVSPPTAPSWTGSRRSSAKSAMPAT